MPSSDGGTDLGDARSAIRREQLRVLLASVPVLAAAYFAVGAVGTFSDRPVAVALLLAPILVVAAVLGYPLVRDRRLLLGGGFLPFFVTYCLAFAVAAGTRVLEGRRVELAGFEEQAPSNVRLFGRFRDLHYRFAVPAPPMYDVVVVTLPSNVGSSYEEARVATAGLIGRAVAQEARGIAFDYTLETSSLVDRILCARIAQAEEAGVPVVLGYRVEDRDGAPVRVPAAPEIRGCVPPERMGTLTGLMESDSRCAWCRPRISPTRRCARSPGVSRRCWRGATRGFPASVWCSSWRPPRLPPCCGVPGRRGGRALPGPLRDGGLGPGG